MLQMDLEDNETAMTSFDTQVEELKGTVESLEAKLEESKAQVTKKSIFGAENIFVRTKLY